MSPKAKRKRKSSVPKVNSYDTYNGEESKSNRIDSFITIILFLGTWLVLGTIFTLWLADKGLVIFLAVILGIIGGFIANILAWLIFRSGFTPMM